MNLTHATFIIGILIANFVLPDSVAFSKTKKKDRASDYVDEETKTDAQAKAGEEAAKKAASIFFPDWGTPEFDWTLSPVLGFKYARYSTDSGSVHTNQTELGIRGELDGIPIAPGNPGLYLFPNAGYAFGQINYTDEQFSNLQEKYQRFWGGGDLQFFYKFYRHTLGVTGGSRLFNKSKDLNVRSTTIKNDFGFLILPFLSGHFTHRYLKAFKDRYDTPFMNEQDNWLHGRFFASLLSFYLDAGPGMTFTKEYILKNSINEQTSEGQISYLLAHTGMKLFWKIALLGSSKYILSSSNDKLGSYANVKLPEENLNTSPSVTMPKDSLTTSGFLGVPNILYGLGVGLYYNSQILNMSEKDGAKKSITEDWGFGISFSTTF